MAGSTLDARPLDDGAGRAGGGEGRGHDRRAGDRAAVVVPPALATVLCLIGITSRSLGFDEAATVTIASQHGSALGSAIAHDGGNMSGYYVLLHVLIGAFGHGPLVIRLPSALASVIGVALISTLGLRLFGRRAAFVSGLLSGVSLPLVFWAQNARGYAPMVALVCGAFLALAALAGLGQAGRPGPDLGGGPAPGSLPPSRRRGSLWIAYVVCMTLAVYCSFVAVLVVPAQLIVLVRRRALARRLVSALVAVGALCVPLALLALNRGSSQLFWVPQPTRKIETQVLQSLTSAGLQPSFHPTVVTTILLIATVMLLVAVSAVILRRARRGEPGQGGAVMALAWFWIPSVIAWLASYVIQPIFVPRNLLMCIPAAGLLLGLGLTDPRALARDARPPGAPRTPADPGWRRALALGVLTALVILRAVPIVTAYGVSPEPWRQSTAYILARARPADCVAFYPLDARMAFEYYVGPANAGRAPRAILPIVRWTLTTPFIERYETLSPAQIARRGAGCRRLWLVSSHEGEPDGPARSRANRARFKALRTGLERAFGPGPVKQFGYASAIHVQLLPGSGSGRRGRG